MEEKNKKQSGEIAPKRVAPKRVKKADTSANGVANGASAAQKKARVTRVRVAKTTRPNKKAQEAKDAVAKDAAQWAVASGSVSTSIEPQIEVAYEAFHEPIEIHQGRADGISQPETVGGEASFNGKKRRRNRNKNKNGRSAEDVRPVFTPALEPTPSNDHHKKVADRAWKMFLAEVSEEGLAFMDDRTARETALRAFKVSEIFTTEEYRRKQRRPEGQGSNHHAKHPHTQSPKPDLVEEDGDDEQDDEQ